MAIASYSLQNIYTSFQPPCLVDGRVYYLKPTIVKKLFMAMYLIRKDKELSPRSPDFKSNSSSSSPHGTSSCNPPTIPSACNKHLQEMANEQTY